MAITVERYIDFRHDALDSYEQKYVKPIEPIAEPYKRRAIRIFDILKANKLLIQESQYSGDTQKDLTLLLDMLSEEN